MAAFHGHVEVGEALIEAGTPISEGPEGILPLHIAALRRHIRFVELLLDHGANALAETESGANALHFLELNETYQAEAVAHRLNIDTHNVTLTGLRPKAAMLAFVSSWSVAPISTRETRVVIQLLCGQL